ncbi:MAG: zinc ABC transporter substrate-binding protein [Tepidisphaeraceae bacterium]|jgi:zinc/manganese transport system substrate-binding protein
MKKKTVGLLVAVVVIVLAAIAIIFRSPPADNSTSHGPVITVIAGENFWGSLITQLGGNEVAVTSIVSDPNADPHEYESNANDAKLFATANYVVLNGAGYDSWGDSLLSASNNPNRKVLVVATLLGKKEGDNPHFWYSPDYVNQVIAQMESDLISIDPKDTAYFQAQYKTLQSSLAEYQNRIGNIKHDFGSTKVASTESIFVYLADAAGLNLISPPEFIDAVAEGNDPPASSVVEFEKQLKAQEPEVLVYNEQTVTPLTENMKKLAAEAEIPTIGITETIQPPDATFQEWMNAQLLQLQNALNAKALGK